MPTKTLYVADLDGTLLSPGAVLSDYSRTVISELIDRGVSFTIATARTPATVTHILRGLKITLPCIMMNGAVSFSFTKMRFCDISKFPKSITNDILILANSCPVTTFLYTFENNCLNVFYKDDGKQYTRRFISERSGTAYKSFKSISDYSQARGEIIYSALLGAKKVLTDYFQRYRKITALDTVLYREVNFNGIYVLESYLAGISKAKAVKRLADSICADKIIAFGDNINDMQMLKQADIGLAVANAAPEVLACADEVIGSNSADGVAKWLLKNVD